MRRTSRIRRQENGLFSLNITSMTDMFTLLLVFLLQSYSTAEFQPDLDKDLQLPLSVSMKESSKVPQVYITRDAVKIDGRVILELKDGHVLAQDLEHPGLVKPLFEALREKKPAESTPDDSILLHADASQSMEDLNPFLSTISAAGFAKVKLATVVGR